VIDDLKLDDEAGRIQALNRLDILDTPEEAPFENIVDLVRKVMQAPICTVALIDQHRQWFKAHRGLNDRETARDISFCTHTIRGAEPFVVRDAFDDPTFTQNPLVRGPPFIRSYAGIPLMTPDGYNVGSLCAIDTKPRAFPEAEIAILRNFAKIVMDELELRQIASSDHLTGALTRRAWTDGAEREVARVLRYGGALSLAMLDIDKFKSINDTFGHPAGDQVICSLAKLCLSTIRSTDLFGRLGGEEFGLLMPETTVDQAVPLAERLRTLFADEPIDLGRTVRSTVSIGVAFLSGETGDLSGLVARADRALYRAKILGRNRTVVDSD
jgi:diguanylate cyclase (GGDEF)-like protein